MASDSLLKQLFSEKPELASLKAERMRLINDGLSRIGEAMTKLGSNQKIPFQELFPQDAGPGATPEQNHAARNNYRNFRLFSDNAAQSEN